MGLAVFSADAAMETSVTTGTGSFSLAGAVTGFRTLRAGLASGATGMFRAESDDRLTWEVFLGVLTYGSPDTLTRAIILASSTGGTSPINWPVGTRYIGAVFAAPHVATLCSEGYLGLGLGTAARLSPLDVCSSGSTVAQRVRARTADNVNAIDFTTNDGLTTRFRIDFSGATHGANFRWNIGGASVYNFAFLDNRNVVLFDGATAVWSTGTSVSDKRLKDVEGRLTGKEAAAIVARLGAVRFRWNDDTVMADGGKPHIGALAQEWREVLPDTVRDLGDILHMDEQKAVPVLAVALAHALERIAALEDKAHAFS